MSKLSCSRFAIYETPCVVWGWDLPEENLRFLQGLDPDYFKHMVSLHSAELEGTDSQYAAVAIRVAYSHALECFFSLLAALIQAPDCVAGWLCRYTERGHLVPLVRDIQRGVRVLTKLRPPEITWAKLSMFVHGHANPKDDEAKLRRRIDRFSELWGHFAHEYLDDTRRTEYNCIKHGLRVRAGGSTLAIGLEETPGTPAPPEAMQVIGSSKFGTTFPIPENWKKYNYVLKRKSRNWAPENLIGATILLSMSIANVISRLRIAAGEPPSQLKFWFPEDDDGFDAPWAKGVGAHEFGFDVVVPIEELTPLSKEEILSVYDVGDGELEPGTPNEAEDNDAQDEDPS